MGQLCVTSVPWVDPPDAQRRRWQRVCAWRDLGWEWPAPSLASLHANPAHSALRRARCFQDAQAAVMARINREVSSGASNFLGAPFARMFVVRTLHSQASLRTLWSVR